MLRIRRHLHNTQAAVNSSFINLLDRNFCRRQSVAVATCRCYNYALRLKNCGLLTQFPHYYEPTAKQYCRLHIKGASKNSERSNCVLLSVGRVMTDHVMQDTRQDLKDKRSKVTSQGHVSRPI